MAKQLHQSELWEKSRENRAGVEPGKSGEKTHPSPAQPKPSREEAQAERMELARRQAADPNYPTEAIIKDLADMLARHWYS